MNRPLLLLALCIASPALAEEKLYYEGNGTIYTMKTNENGLVLTSKYPVAVFTPGKGDTAVEQMSTLGWDVRPRTIYLGKTCEAASDEFGEGRWSMSSGSFAGFAVEFPKSNVKLKFDFQEISARTEWRLVDCAG
jgi:hypothetical protein